MGRALHLNKFESSSPKDVLCHVWLKLARQFWLRGFLNFIIVFLLFCNYPPLEKDGVLPLNKLESPSPKNALCQVWLKLAHWFLKRRLLNFVIVFSLSPNYLPLEKSRDLHLNKLESSPTKDSSEEDIFNFVNVFSLFHNYLPLEMGGGGFIWTILNPLYPKMLCAKFGCNWPSGSGEDDF